jgi:hypothetical protein
MADAPSPTPQIPDHRAGRTGSMTGVKEVSTMEWHGIIFLITTAVFGFLLR